MRDRKDYRSTIHGNQVGPYPVPLPPAVAAVGLCPGIQANLVPPRWRTMCTIIDRLCQEGPLWERMVNVGVQPQRGWKTRTSNAPRDTVDVTVIGRDAHLGEQSRSKLGIHLKVATPVLDAKYETPAYLDWYREFRVPSVYVSPAAGGTVPNAEHSSTTAGDYVMASYLDMYTEMCNVLSNSLGGALPPGNAGNIAMNFVRPFEFLQQLMNAVPAPANTYPVNDLGPAAAPPPIVNPLHAGNVPAPQPALPPDFDEKIYFFMRASRLMFHACSTETAYVLINRPALGDNDQWRNRLRYAIQLLGYDIIPTTITALAGAAAVPANIDNEYQERKREIRHLVRYFRCNELHGMIDFEFPSHLSSILRPEEGVVGKANDTITLATWDARIPQRHVLMRHDWELKYTPAGTQQRIGLFHHGMALPFSWAKRGLSCIDPTVAGALPFDVFSNIIIADTFAGGGARIWNPADMTVSYLDPAAPLGHVDMEWGHEFRKVVRSMLSSHRRLKPSINLFAYRGTEERTYGMQPSDEQIPRDGAGSSRPRSEIEMTSPMGTKTTPIVAKKAARFGVFSPMPALRLTPQQQTASSASGVLMFDPFLREVLCCIFYNDSFSLGIMDYMYNDTFERMCELMTILSTDVNIVEEQSPLQVKQFYENVFEVAELDFETGIPMMDRLYDECGLTEVHVDPISQAEGEAVVDTQSFVMQLGDKTVGDTITVHNRDYRIKNIARPSTLIDA